MTFAKSKPAAVTSLLRCLNVDGEPRYDLPAFAVNRFDQYEAFWRPRPAPIIHHTKGETYQLPESEFIFVGLSLNHCVSLSVDERGLPTGAYANVNLSPVKTPSGWQWKDLELDVKLVVDHAGSWSPILLDLDEFDSASLNADLRDLAIREVDEIFSRVAASVMPFTVPSIPWLGLFDPNLLPESFEDHNLLRP